MVFLYPGLPPWASLASCLWHWICDSLYLYGLYTIIFAEIIPPINLIFSALGMTADYPLFKNGRSQARIATSTDNLVPSARRQTCPRSNIVNIKPRIETSIDYPVPSARRKTSLGRKSEVKETTIIASSIGTTLRYLKMHTCA
jgi:hypothetical protein